MVWDTAVTGFAARRQKSDAVTYLIKYRATGGRQRWHTIGRHGAPWTPDSARAEARRILGETVKGADPAAEKQAKRKAETVVARVQPVAERKRIDLRDVRALAPGQVIWDSAVPGF